MRLTFAMANNVGRAGGYLLLRWSEAEQLTAWQTADVVAAREPLERLLAA